MSLPNLVGCIRLIRDLMKDTMPSPAVPVAPEPVQPGDTWSSRLIAWDSGRGKMLGLADEAPLFPVRLRVGPWEVRGRTAEEAADVASWLEEQRIA